MTKMTSKLALGAILCTGFVFNVSAQDSCADVDWKASTLEAMHDIDENCLEMVDENGAKYARLEGTIAGQSPAGPVLRYSHNDGSYGEMRRTYPPEGMVSRIDGVDVDLGDLDDGQKVNIYVNDSFWNIPAPPAAPAAAAAPPPPPPAPEPAPEPEPEPEPVVLPSTAGSLGWLALFGSLFLITGGVMRFARKF
jgi:hypothetical protein